MFADVRNGLRAVFGTKNPCTLAIPGTGSAGMETAVTNFVDPGAKLGIFVNGFFNTPRVPEGVDDARVR